MKKLLVSALVFCVLLTATGCFSYKDMNRSLFYTLGVADCRDSRFLFYGEGFKAYRGEGDKAGKEKRIVLFGQGNSLTDAVEKMRSTVNYPIDYAGNKVFLISKRLSQVGISDFFDVINRDQKPSMRVYLMVYDGDVDELMNTSMEDEKFMGLYLYELMNAQDESLAVIANQYFQFVRDMDTGSGVNVLPVLKLTVVQKEEKSGLQSAPAGRGRGKGGVSSSVTGGSQSGGGSGGDDGSEDSTAGNAKPIIQPYVKIDGAAVFVKDKLTAMLSSKEIETYKLVTQRVRTGLIDTENPNAPGKSVGFTILKNKSKSTVSEENGRILLHYNVDLRVVLLGAEKGIHSGPETEKALKAMLKADVEKQARALFSKMKAQNIDLFNVKRQLELSRLPMWKDKDVLSKTDFDIRVSVTLDGYGELKSAYY